MNKHSRARAARKKRSAERAKRFQDAKAKASRQPGGHSAPRRQASNRPAAKQDGGRSSAGPSVDVSALQGAFAALIPELQKSVAALGYVEPTPIQAQCIPHVLDGGDVLGTAQTGTGKTAAFALPVLERLSANRRRPKSGTPRALVLAPTRELAAQIGNSMREYGHNLPISGTVIFGGVNQHRQVKALRRGVDVLVATPGRLLDLMNQGHIALNEVEIFVLDEVDRMLDMGFAPDIKRVMKGVPEKRQTLFFSATMPKKIAELAKSMLTQPLRVAIKAESPTVDRIRQKVLFVNKSNKAALLKQVVAEPEVQRAIVFTQMKHMANRVVTSLESSGVKAVAIHGNKSQGARTKALEGFRRGRYQVLVATDVAARGIDVDDISHVINYDLPVDSETYVHRIGRTARAGAEGDAVSFCSAEDRAYLRAIERLLGDPVPVEEGHDFHCEESRNSTAPAPKMGRGGRGGNHRGRPSGRNNRGGRHARGRGGAGGGRGQRGGRPGGGGGRGRRPARNRSSAAG